MNAIKFFQNMQETAAVSNTLFQNPDGIGHSALVEGKVGMVLAGSWFRGTYESGGLLSDVQDKLMYIPAPVGTKEVSQALDVTCLGIFSQTEHPQEAFELLEYLTLHEESVTSRSSIGFNLPVSKKYMDTLPNETEFDKQILATVNKQLETFSPTSARVCPWVSYTSITTLFDKFYLPVLYKKSTLEQAVKTINSEIDILVEEGKELMGE
jgi:ABC-type glycerol-3-phosphate transport system substrate-binding protein